MDLIANLKSFNRRDSPSPRRGLYEPAQRKLRARALTAVDAEVTQKAAEENVMPLPQDIGPKEDLFCP